MANFISLILLLLPTYLIRFTVFGIPTTVLEILIYIVFLYGFWQTRQDGFKPIPRKIYLPIGLLIFALIISTIISPDKRTALGELKGFFIDPLLVGWLIFQYLKEKDITKIFAGLIGSGLFVGIHTIVQKFLGHVTADGRVIGIFGYSPNYVALFLAPIAVLLIAYGLTLVIQKKYFPSIFYFLFSIFYLVAIYFSGSRGGFLAVGGGLGIFVILYYWTWIRAHLAAKIMIAVLIIMALATTWSLFRPDFSLSPETGGRATSSNNVRFQIWQASTELAIKNPKNTILGVGLGNFQNAFDKLTKERANFPEYITPMALTPHNLFLMFWFSSGLLGLVAFLWLLVIFYREGFKKLLSSKTTPIILAIVSTIIIYGFIESSIWKNDLGILFWTFWTLIWIIDSSKFKSPLPKVRHANAK